MRSTHTYAELEVSPQAYDEIRAKLDKAGYQHAFMRDGTIDMHGIGLTREGNGGAAECAKCETLDIPPGQCPGE